MSLPVTRSRRNVTPFPTDFTGSLSEYRETGESSMPLAYSHIIPPCFPKIFKRYFLSAEAMSPMVKIPRERSLSDVACPTPKSSPAGRGQRSSLKFSLDMTVVASGFLYSLPIFARTLLKETPAERVMPSSLRTVLRIVSAISRPEPKRLRLAVTSSHDSSMLKGSTMSVKR